MTAITDTRPWAGWWPWRSAGTRSQEAAPVRKEKKAPGVPPVPSMACEIARTLGLGKDAFTRKSRIRARKSQVRLRQMLEIMGRVEAETGSPLAAYAWFRSAPLPGFGGATPDMLVRQGNAEQVHTYLDRVAAGGYA